MEHFKLSTSRDFRINGATLEAALHYTIEDEEEHNEESVEVSFIYCCDEIILTSPSRARGNEHIDIVECNVW